MVAVRMDRRGSRSLALVMTLFLLTTTVIVLAAAARTRCEGRIAKLGTRVADVMEGNERRNVIAGRAGADKLYGRGEADRLCGNGGDDRLVGGRGHDRLNGGAGNDELFGERRQDLLRGGAGADVLRGGRGRDVLRGGRGHDLLTGGPGWDILIGGPGHDVLRGGAGFDTCSGGERYVSCERIIADVLIDVELGVSASTFEVVAGDVVPGDEIERIVDLKNSSTRSLRGVALTTTASPSSTLDADASDGLQMTIERCSAAWTTLPGAAPSYLCAGTVSTVAAERPVIVSDLELANLSSLQPGGLDHLLVRLRLPSSAGEDAQNAASMITYTFNA
jgi:hypothetical protein